MFRFDWIALEPFAFSNSWQYEKRHLQGRRLTTLWDCYRGDEYVIAWQKNGQGMKNTERLKGVRPIHFVRNVRSSFHWGSLHYWTSILRVLNMGIPIFTRPRSVFPLLTFHYKRMRDDCEMCVRCDSEPAMSKLVLLVSWMNSSRSAVLLGEAALACFASGVASGN